MGCNTGHQVPLSLVSWLPNTGVQVSYQEDICMRGATTQGLLHPTHLRLFNGWYVCPKYIPMLSPHCQHKTRHVRVVVFHSLKVPYILPLPRDDNASPILDLQLRSAYRIDSALLHVDTLRQICLLEDADTHIVLILRSINNTLSVLFQEPNSVFSFNPSIISSAVPSYPYFIIPVIVYIFKV